MKISLQLGLLFSLSLLIPGLSFADASTVLESSTLNPYIGVDAQWRGVAVKGLNNSALVKHAPGVNVYGGVQFATNLGLEVGAHLVKRTKDSTSTKLKGLHASLVGNYPIACLSNKQLSAIGLVGVSHIKYNHKDKVTSFDYKKLRPRVGLGAEYALSPSVTWRTMGTWEGTFSKKPVNYNPKQAYGVSTGLQYKF